MLDQPTQQSPAFALEARGIAKRFDGVSVLHGIDLALRAGEIHALVGENGAGKSTLMKILSGIFTDYEGTLAVDGEAVRFESVRDAQLSGVAIIHQELNLVPELSIADNIFLGREPVLGGVVVDRRALARAARDLLKRLGVTLDPSARVGGLRVGEQQLVEIAKALSLDARIVIMDEPTSALSPPECRRLFAIIRQLAGTGVAIVYISHRMDEVSELADRVTVLRDGRRVLTAPAADLTPERIIAQMVGREVTPAPPRPPAERSRPALAVDGLGLRSTNAQGAVKDIIADVSFTLGRGEILGIGGLLGAGRTEVLETIFGSATGVRRGRISVDGSPVELAGPRDAIRHGIALVTEDRKTTGLLLRSTIRDNLTLPSQPAIARMGLCDRGAEDEIARNAVARLQIRCRSADQVVAQLSGGNQQKVVMGKWLAIGPSILLLDEPTRGIDVGAKKEIYDLVFALAEDGLAIIVVTSELPELLLLSDRILVMREGRQAGVLGRAEASEEAVMRLASPRGSLAAQRAA